MDFRCGMNNLFVHSCKIKHIWDKFCLLFGFKELNCASNLASAQAILTKGDLLISENMAWDFSAQKEIMSHSTFLKLPRLAILL